MINKITIELNEDQVSFKAEKPIYADDFLNMLFTTSLGFLTDIVAKAPEDMRGLAKEELYDLFNQGASKVLENFAPEYELHPGLTAQAILEAENKIILENRLNEVERGS